MTNLDTRQTTYRPPSILITGWWLLASGALGLLTPLYIIAVPQAREMYEAYGLPIAETIVFSLVGALFYAVCGAAILKREPRGRTLYLVGTPLLLLVSAVLYGAALALMWLSLVFGLVVFFVFAFLLTRPTANAYFAGTLVEKPEEARRLSAYRRSRQSRSDLRRIFGVLFLVGGGYWLLGILVALPLVSTVEGSAPAGIFVFGILALPALVAFGLGVWLWGAARWMASLGWTLAVVGVLTAGTGLMLAVLPHVAAYRDVFVQTGLDPSIFTIMSRAGWLGLAVGLAGAAMVWHRWRADYEAVSIEDEA